MHVSVWENGEDRGKSKLRGRPNWMRSLPGVGWK